MSNMDRLTSLYIQAQQNTPNRNAALCIGHFFALCRALSDHSLKVEIDPKKSDSRTVHFVFTGFNHHDFPSFERGISLSFEVVGDRETGYKPVLMIPGEPEFVLTDDASYQRAVTPLLRYFAQTGVDEEAEMLTAAQWDGLSAYSKYEP